MHRALNFLQKPSKLGWRLARIAHAVPWPVGATLLGESWHGDKRNDGSCANGSSLGVMMRKNSEIMVNW